MTPSGKSINAIWEKDREADLEEFMKEDPKLSEFEAQIKHYEDLEVEIMGLPEFYDVGPIALYTGHCAQQNKQSNEQPADSKQQQQQHQTTKAQPLSPQNKPKNQMQNYKCTKFLCSQNLQVFRLMYVFAC